MKADFIWKVELCSQDKGIFYKCQDVTFFGHNNLSFFLNVYTMFHNTLQ